MTVVLDKETDEVFGPFNDEKEAQTYIDEHYEGLNKPGNDYTVEIKPLTK